MILIAKRSNSSSVMAIAFIIILQKKIYAVITILIIMNTNIASFPIAATPTPPPTPRFLQDIQHLMT